MLLGKEEGGGGGPYLALAVRFCRGPVRMPFPQVDLEHEMFQRTGLRTVTYCL